MSGVAADQIVDTVGAFVGPPGVLAAGAEHGPLAGLRLGVKDLFDVAGTVTGAGNPTFADAQRPATASAPAVQRLIDAGATVVGKTVTDELAFSLSGTNVHYGTPRNVAAPGRVPGGSSSGSAAAVAARLADLALGTDTGGSIRVPASYCGIVGWRPTHGSIPLDGVVPLAPSFDTVGLLTRRVDVLEAAARALLRQEPTGVAGVSAPTTLAFLAEAMHDVAPPVATAVRSCVSGMVDATVALDIDLGTALTALRTRQSWEAWQSHGAWITDAQPDMGPDIAARFAAGAQVTIDDVAAADVVRADLRSRVLEATADGTILVLPAAAGAAPEIAPSGDDERAAHEARRVATMRLTCVAGLAGAPVLVLPLALDEGLPLGVAFMAAPGADLELIAWARSTFPQFDRPAAV